MPHANGFTQRGVASWYGKKFHGRKTSSGEVYDMYAMTAAHKTLPLGTWVRVHNRDNGRTLDVRINDRGPFVDNRVIDLSRAAARQLDMLHHGRHEGVLAVGDGDQHPPVGPLFEIGDRDGAIGGRRDLVVGAAEQEVAQIAAARPGGHHPLAG